MKNEVAFYAWMVTANVGTMTGNFYSTAIGLIVCAIILFMHYIGKKENNIE